MEFWFDFVASRHHFSICSNRRSYLFYKLFDCICFVAPIQIGKLLFPLLLSHSYNNNSFFSIIFLLMKNANSDVLHYKQKKVCRVKEIDCNTCPPSSPSIDSWIKIVHPVLCLDYCFLFLAVFAIAEWTIIPRCFLFFVRPSVCVYMVTIFRTWRFLQDFMPLAFNLEMETCLKKNKKTYGYLLGESV